MTEYIYLIGLIALLMVGAVQLFHDNVEEAYDESRTSFAKSGVVDHTYFRDNYDTDTPIYYNPSTDRWHRRGAGGTSGPMVSEAVAATHVDDVDVYRNR